VLNTNCSVICEVNYFPYLKEQSDCLYSSKTVRFNVATPSPVAGPCFKPLESDPHLITYLFKSNLNLDTICQAFMAVMCCVVVGYQRFGGPRCLHHQGETLVTYHNTTR